MQNKKYYALHNIYKLEPLQALYALYLLRQASPFKSFPSSPNIDHTKTTDPLCYLNAQMLYLLLRLKGRDSSYLSF